MHGTTRPSKQCARCGCVFVKKPEYSYDEWRAQRYCSRACVHADTWTPERITTLTRMWAADNTASITATALGDGITRSAVLSKVHRLALPERAKRPRKSKPSQARPGVKRKRPVSLAEPRKPRRAPDTGQTRTAGPERPRAVVVPIVAPSSPVTLMDLRMPISQCRWPIGEPRGADTQYCGADTVRGSSYCQAHYARCYRPVPGLPRRFMEAVK